jgi:RNA polymerase sigma-70 factor (ECF subfamily)
MGKSTPRKRPRPDSGDPDATNTSLLAHTQQYLQSLLERRDADSLLAQSWDEFYRVYNGLIRRFIVAHQVRGADIEDCLQEVWTAVALKLADFEHPHDRPGLRAWLYSVVRSKAADVLRRNLRRTARGLEAAIGRGVEPISREPDPAAALQEKWDAAMIATAMEELRRLVSPTTYQAIHMRTIEGRSEAETARALNLTPEQVRYRKHRAQQKLRAIVEVFTGEAPEE